jgi:phospholipid/cholesterol/gamma-HCH transport system permease protein
MNVSRNTATSLSEHNKFSQLIQLLGHKAVDIVISVGKASRFMTTMILQTAICWRRPNLLIKEVYFVGVLSLVIIIVSGLFVGLVMGLQMYETLKRFGSGSIVGMVVALSLVRELGPVLSALLISSRAGSAVTAEIGLMKATEQLSAMEMMAIQPVSRVVVPRFWAGVISVPLLTSIFNVMGIFGGYLVAVQFIGVDEGLFWSQMQEAVNFRIDVVNGFIKSVIFGFAIMLIAVFQGYYSEPTAEGVSTATTRTVVTSALAILSLDFVLTAFMFRGV